MNKSKILYFIIATSFGIFITIFGGIDDSPGAQFLGLLVIIINIVVLVKSKNKGSTYS